MPIAEQRKIIANRLNAEKRVDHTTSCPASSPSCFICAAMGALDTATGVANSHIRNVNVIGPGESE